MDSFGCPECHLSSTYNYKTQIEKELVGSLPNAILTLAQAAKVVRTAAAILRLNLLECALLSWLLRRSQYSLRDLTESANHISLFEEDHNKELLLLILLNAYYVKSYLNKGQAPEIDADVLCMIPQFAKIYKSWRPDSLLKDAALSDLNPTFTSWTQPPRRAKPDYNQYVNKILQLSKTYNVTGNEEEGQPKKKRKQNEPSQSQHTPPQDLEPENNFMNKSHRSIWLRSSRVDEQPLNLDIFGLEEEPERQQDDFLLRRSTRQRSYGYMNFDLDHSKTFQPGLNSLFANSSLGTNSKGLFSEEKGVQPKAQIKQTSSFDEVKQ